MAKRQREWAKRARAALIERLGGRCVSCGTTRRLEIDHIHGCDWRHESLDSSARIARYRKEADQKLVQVMCRRCNAKKGHPNRAVIDPGVTEPF